MTTQKLTRNYCLVAIALLIFSIISFNFLDSHIANYMHQQFTHDTWVYQTCTWIAKITSPSDVLYAMLGIVFLGAYMVLKDKHKLAQQCAYITVTYLLLFVVVAILKFTLARYRPAMMFDHQQYGLSWFNSDYLTTSMPSGHTSMNFAVIFPLIVLIYNQHKVLSWVLIGYGTMVAISRVMMTAHYTADVAIGTALALLMTSITAKWLLPQSLKIIKPC